MSYITVPITEAVEGDEVYQGARWTPIKSARVTASGNVVITFENGGAHAMPLANAGAARREVVEVEVLCHVCEQWGTPIAGRCEYCDTTVRSGASMRTPRVSPVDPHGVGPCALHSAYAADYCPLCGTARVIGGTR
jgi:hypothetical protein